MVLQACLLSLMIYLTPSSSYNKMQSSYQPPLKSSPKQFLFVSEAGVSVDCSVVEKIRDVQGAYIAHVFAGGLHWNRLPKKSSVLHSPKITSFKL